jgi:hypothetical protein
MIKNPYKTSKKPFIIRLSQRFIEIVFYYKKTTNNM